MTEGNTTEESCIYYSISSCLLGYGSNYMKDIELVCKECHDTGVVRDVTICNMQVHNVAGIKLRMILL